MSAFEKVLAAIKAEYQATPAERVAWAGALSVAQRFCEVATVEVGRVTGFVQGMEQIHNGDIVDVIAKMNEAQVEAVRGKDEGVELVSGNGGLVHAYSRELAQAAAAIVCHLSGMNQASTEMAMMISARLGEDAVASLHIPVFPGSSDELNVEYVNARTFAKRIGRPARTIQKWGEMYQHLPEMRKSGNCWEAPTRVWDQIRSQVRRGPKPRMKQSAVTAA